MSEEWVRIPWDKLRREMEKARGRQVNKGNGPSGFMRGMQRAIEIIREAGQMKEVQVIRSYKCSDGLTFETIDEANSHQLYLNVYEWVKEHIRFFDVFHDDEYCQAIALMLIKHDESLSKVLGWKEE